MADFRRRLVFSALEGSGRPDSDEYPHPVLPFHFQRVTGFEGTVFGMSKTYVQRGAAYVVSECLHALSRDAS